jgi:epoxyqueuosine reductase
MNTINQTGITEDILAQIKTYGAMSAGIASVADLKDAPSYSIYDKNPYYDAYEGIADWPDEAKSVLVYTFSHERSKPELDWEAKISGTTLGNAELIRIQKEIKKWLQEELGIKVISLPYRVEKGGIFLKDCAVLGGIGVFGKNNLLITPELGPQVRLRASFLDIELAPTRLPGFDPCADCAMPCLRVCPQDAFRNGHYERDYCHLEMEKNRNNPVVTNAESGIPHIKFCRSCEFACPVGDRSPLGLIRT